MADRRRGHGHGAARRLVPWVVLAIAGCDDHVGCAPSLTTENGQIELHDPAVVAGACRRLREPGPLLVDAPFCPSFSCGDGVAGCADEDGNEIDGARVAACFEQTIDGPGEIVDGCLRATAPGTITWSFAVTACPAQLDGYAPDDDRLVLPAVDVADVTAHLQAPGDAFAARSLVGVDDEALPQEPQLSAGETAHVVAHTAVPLAIVLAHPEHEAPVAWRPEQWALEVEAVAGEAPVTQMDGLGLVTITLAADATAHLTIRKGDVVLDIGDVTGVDASQLASIEVIAGYLPPEEGETTHGPPAGARAIVRTDDGTVVWGADVQWQVLDGALPMWRDPDRAWTPDYVALADEEGRTCADPPKRTGTRRATISATLGDLEVEHELRWREPGEDSSIGEQIAELFGNDEGEKSPFCEGPGFGATACVCDAQRQRPGLAPAALLVGFVWLAARRRRRAQP